MSKHIAANESEKEEIFARADNLLFKEGKTEQAHALYLQILDIDKNNIDAINSVAYCIKFSEKNSISKKVFDELIALYSRSIAIDTADVESNFNMGLLHLQVSMDMDLALKHFQRSTLKDVDGDYRTEVFRSQFAKSYYNIGMIYDKLGKISEAADSYKKSLQKCEEDPEQKLVQSTTYKKAGTNYAVALEKLGMRDEAIILLKDLKASFENEVRVHNNLGIIQKRKGDLDQAIASYKLALSADPNSFFPNYNMAVLLATEGQYQQAIVFFKEALSITQKVLDSGYELNVLLNLALCFEQLKEIKNAIDQLENAKKIDPKNEQIVKKINALKELLKIDSQVRVRTKQVSHGINKDKLKIDLAKNATSSARNSVHSEKSSRRQSFHSNDSAAEIEQKLQSVTVGLNFAKVNKQTTGDIQSPRVGDSQVESIINEDVEDQRQSQNRYLGWTNWDRITSMQKVQSANLEEQVRAWYRLGIIEQEECNLTESLTNLRKVKSIDESFCSDIVNLRIAEVTYKLNLTDEALEALLMCEKTIKTKDKYMVHLLRGKCYDKVKNYISAVDEYMAALSASKSLTLSNLIAGNMQFRLGWSRIRAKRDVEKGIADMEVAAKFIPDNFEILLKLAGAIFLELPDNNENNLKVQQLLDKLIQIEPEKCSEALILQGKLLHRKEDFTGAISVFDRAMHMQVEEDSDAPPKSTCFFYQGMCYEKLKDFKQAILNFKKCLTIDTNHFGASIHLANLLANLGEGQRAAKYFKHAIKIDPDSVNAQFGLAKAIQQYSDDKTAPIFHFEEVLRREPDHFKALTQMGILYLDREEFEQSAEYLKRALIANKQFPLALVSMGNLLFETGNAEQAIKYHHQALKFNEKELQALIGLGNAYYDTGSPENAVKYYEMALVIDEQLSDVHYNLGNALYLVEKVDDAIVHYQRAITLNPKKPESFYNLGNALCVKADYENAIQAYNQAIDLDPKNAPAFYNLGNALYMLNKFQESVKAYQHALEINSKSPECHFNLASAYNDLADYKGAIKHYIRSIELDDKNMDAYLCLGSVYEQMNQVNKAQNVYEKALLLDCENTRAKEALQKLFKK